MKSWHEIVVLEAPALPKDHPITIAHHTRLDEYMPIEWIADNCSGIAVSGDELARVRRKMWA